MTNFPLVWSFLDVLCGHQWWIRYFLNLTSYRYSYFAENVILLQLELLQKRNELQLPFLQRSNFVTHICLRWANNFDRRKDLRFTFLLHSFKAEISPFQIFLVTSQRFLLGSFVAQVPALAEKTLLAAHAAKATSIPRKWASITRSPIVLLCDSSFLKQRSGTKLHICHNKWLTEQVLRMIQLTGVRSSLPSIRRASLSWCACLLYSGSEVMK